MLSETVSHREVRQRTGWHPRTLRRKIAAGEIACDLEGRILRTAFEQHMAALTAFAKGDQS
jgi:hypothetical protein